MIAVTKEDIAVRLLRIMKKIIVPAVENTTAHVRDPILLVSSRLNS